MTSISSLILLLSCLVTLNGAKTDNLIKSYFLHYHDFNDPKTLKDEIEKKETEGLTDYYIAFTDIEGKVKKIEFVSSNKIKMTLEYSYTGNRVSGLTSYKYHGQTFTKCNSTYDKKIRTTECFNEKGTLILEETYHERTKNYSLVKYDSTGTMILHEWGKY